MSKAFFQIRAGDLAMRRGMATGGGGGGERPVQFKYPQHDFVCN